VLELNVAAGKFLHSRCLLVDPDHQTPFNIHYMYIKHINSQSLSILMAIFQVDLG